MKKKASKAQMAGVKAFQEQHSAENIIKGDLSFFKRSGNIKIMNDIICDIMTERL